MTDLSFLTNYAVPIIVGICLCIGYVLKNIVTTDVVNKYIPAIMGVLGVILNVWMNMALHLKYYLAVLSLVLLLQVYMKHLRIFEEVRKDGIYEWDL